MFYLVGHFEFHEHKNNNSALYLEVLNMFLQFNLNPLMSSLAIMAEKCRKQTDRWMDWQDKNVCASSLMGKGIIKLWRKPGSWKHIQCMVMLWYFVDIRVQPQPDIFLHPALWVGWLELYIANQWGWPGHNVIIEARPKSFHTRGWHSVRNINNTALYESHLAIFLFFTTEIYKVTTNQRNAILT